MKNGAKILQNKWINYWTIKRPHLSSHKTTNLLFKAESEKLRTPKLERGFEHDTSWYSDCVLITKQAGEYSIRL